MRHKACFTGTCKVTNIKKMYELKKNYLVPHMSTHLYQSSFEKRKMN